MSWNDAARAENKRDTDRYPSDLTDAEREVIELLLPADFPPVSIVQGYFYSWTCQVYLKPSIGFWFPRLVNWKAVNPAQRLVQSTANVSTPQKVRAFANVTPEQKSKAANATSLSTRLDCSCL